MMDEIERSERLSAQLISAAWEAGPNAAAIALPNGIVVAANRAYYHLYDLTPQEVIGHDFSMIFPEEQRPAARNIYQYVFGSPLPSGHWPETTVIRTDGTALIVEADYTFLTNQGKRTAMLISIRNITKRKQVEDLLRESQLKLHLALQAGHMGTWDWDLASNSIRCSANLETVLGLVPQTVLTWQAFLERIHPQDRSQVQQTVNASLEEGSDLIMRFRLIQPDETAWRIASFGQVIADDAGSPLHLLNVATLQES